MTTKKKLIVIFVVLASIGSAAAGTGWWWTNPLLMPGRHRLDVYALDEDVSWQPASPPGFVSRLIGMCDADSYYVTKDGHPYCLVLSADTSSGQPKPLAQIDVTKDGDHLVIHRADVETLRSTATQIPKLTYGDSHTLVLVARGRPVAVVPVELLTGETVGVDVFD